LKKWKALYVLTVLLIQIIWIAAIIIIYYPNPEPTPIFTIPPNLGELKPPIPPLPPR
jgi:hypothetical protein